MLASTTYPKVPLWLGLAGLIPFVALSLSLAFGVTLPLFADADTMRVALVGYGVVILSFLGGVRWGVALGEERGEPGAGGRDFIIAVVPSLVAWFAWFQPAPADVWWLVAAHILLGLLDYGLACRVLVDEWFGRLRLGLSAVAAASLMLVALTVG
jgi:hypothetical protein